MRRDDTVLPSTHPTLKPTQYQSRLWIAKDSFNMFFVEPRPNWWHRMWQRVLLGFIWEEIDDEQTD